VVKLGQEKIVGNTVGSTPAAHRQDHDVCGAAPEHAQQAIVALHGHVDERDIAVVKSVVVGDQVTDRIAARMREHHLRQALHGARQAEGGHAKAGPRITKFNHRAVGK
jgi:hypothetical protein